MDLSLLGEIVTIMASAVAVVYVFRRLNLPPILGFLLTGILIGPGGLGLIHSRHDIEILAEIGVILLLFEIGLEFSLAELWNMRRFILTGGVLQLLGTIAISGFLARGIGLPSSTALFVGLLIGLSSTAIVFRLLSERGEIATIHGRYSTAVLLLQDIMIVPMLLFTPLIAGQGTSLQQSLLTLGRSVAILAAIVAMASWIYPWILEHVIHTRSREIFTLTTLLVVLGTAYLTALSGTSLAAGAFLAGLVVSESEYAYQILTEISPFKDAFNSLFFISIGMLVQPAGWLTDPGWILLVLVVVIVLKALVVFGTGLISRIGWRRSLLAGFALAQVGEFSFILAQEGIQYGIMSEALYQDFLSVSLLSMILTPGLFYLGDVFTDRLEWDSGVELAAGKPSHAHPDIPTDHVIIAGFGPVGQDVARVLEQREIPYVVVELNPQTVRRLDEKRIPVVYGDASRQLILQKSNLSEARALMVTIDDPPYSRRILSVARRLNPEIPVIARTRFLSDIDSLIELGANVVVPEEGEVALQMARSLLQIQDVPESDIERQIRALREHRYEQFRHPSGS